MLNKIRQMIIGLNARVNQAEESRTLRQVVLGASKLARKPDEFTRHLEGIMETERFHAEECSTWLTTQDIRDGKSGPFDGCDLSAWLAIAEKASVPTVPAFHILHLSEEEAELASGEINMGNSPVIRRSRSLIAKAIEGVPHEPFQETNIDREALVEKLYAALDDVPADWMVRTSHCGSSELKSLAGFGLAGTRSPDVVFGNDLEVGPGWVRNGNRRRVNLQDSRLIKLHVEGPHRGMDFWARPWIESARYIEATDPHREGTPFAGKGLWPLEWRAFIQNGKVVGVSNYYGFVGEASPENARVALAVRDMAQKVANAVVTQKLAPRTMTIEHARRHVQIASHLEAHGYHRNAVNFTVDFLETKDGLVLLEAGPAASPVGGGHPCCFAGAGGVPSVENPPQTVGVAFRPMNHIIVADPSTWKDGDRRGAILSWEDAEKLAHGQA